jgi:hypothetical protein
MRAAAAVQSSGVFMSLSTPREMDLLRFFQFGTLILGMCASYRHMAVGPHYPVD